MHVVLGTVLVCSQHSNNVSYYDGGSPDGEPVFVTEVGKGFREEVRLKLGLEA